MSGSSDVPSASFKVETASLIISGAADARESACDSATAPAAKRSPAMKTITPKRVIKVARPRLMRCLSMKDTAGSSAKETKRAERQRTTRSATVA